MKPTWGQQLNVLRRTGRGAGVGRSGWQWEKRRYPPFLPTGSKSKLTQSLPLGASLSSVCFFPFSLLPSPSPPLLLSFRLSFSSPGVVWDISLPRPLVRFLTLCFGERDSLLLGACGLAGRDGTQTSRGLGLGADLHAHRRPLTHWDASMK